MAFILGAFLLLLTVSYLLARPLILTDTADGDADPSRAPDDLVRRIADLDFDLATGKLAEDDHARLRAAAMERAMELIASARALGAGAGANEGGGESPDELPMHLQDDIERLVAARRRAVDTSAR